MDDEQKNNNLDPVSPEEQKAEEEALAEVQGDELKAKIAEEFDIVQEDEPELFEKLLNKEIANREKLSKTIKQKISWRDKANTAKKPTDTPETKEVDDPEKGKPLTDEEFDRKFNERMNKQELKTLNLSEEIEKEVQDLATLKGISIGEAAKHPYIVSVMEDAEKEARINNSSPKRSGKGNYSNVSDPSEPLDASKFELDTEEGQKAWEQAKQTRRQDSE